MKATNAQMSEQLSVSIEDGQLKISIGIALLAFAVQHQDNWPKEFAVTDLNEFARSMARQLQREEEDGTTPVHRMRALLPRTAPEDAIGAYYARQIEWSRETFGPALRTKGVIDHIRKELTEIEREPHDLSEWIDVVILAMDGFWRHGGKAEDLMPALLAKQQKNMARVWPDWRTMSEDSAIEHDRSQDLASKACGLADPSTRDCKNMKEVGGGMDGERYRCGVCGKGYFLDYEEMK